MSFLGNEVIYLLILFMRLVFFFFFFEWMEAKKNSERGGEKGYVREMSKTVFTGKEVTIFKLDTHAFFPPLAVERVT